MKNNSSFAVLIFFVILGIGAALSYTLFRASANVGRHMGFSQCLVHCHSRFFCN